MKIRDIITLDDNNKYLIVSKLYYNNKDYYYLVDINNPQNLLFCYEDKQNLVELTDRLLLNKLLPIFSMISNKYLKEIMI